MGMPTYKGAYVLPVKPNWIGDPVHAYDHPYDLLKGIGKAYSESRLDETQFRFRANYILSRADTAIFFDFFDMLKGRCYPFWLPSWQPDIKVAAAFDAGATQLIIEDCEYPAFWLPNPAAGRHLYIEWPDSSAVIRGVSDAPNSTTITLDEAVGKSCSEAELPRLVTSFLYPVRFDQDELRIDYTTPDVAETEVAFKTVFSEAEGLV